MSLMRCEHQWAGMEGRYLPLGPMIYWPMSSGLCWFETHLQIRK